MSCLNLVKIRFLKSEMRIRFFGGADPDPGVFTKRDPGSAFKNLRIPADPESGS